MMLNCHIFQAKDVSMRQELEQFDLSQGGDREAILLIVHDDLLQGD